MDIKKIIKTLEAKEYEVSFFDKKEQAVEYLNKKIDNKIVGFGDSATLTSLNLYEELLAHNEVFDPQNCPKGSTFLEVAKKCLTTDIFITSVNSIAETGELVNIDGTGNRIAGSLFGHEKVYFVVGTNKFVPTLEDAIWRTRNVVAPKNTKRLNLKTPCARKGDKCYDCKSPDRICNGMMVYFKKMNDMNMEIILINEELGY